MFQPVQCGNHNKCMGNVDFVVLTAHLSIIDCILAKIERQNRVPLPPTEVKIPAVQMLLH